MILQVTDREELQYKGVPTVVCFTNPVTCAPCKMLKPHFEVAHDAFDESVQFAEVDVLEHMDIAVEYGVSGTPTVLFIGENGVTHVTSRTALPLIEEINSLANE